MMLVRNKGAAEVLRTPDGIAQRQSIEQSFGAYYIYDNLLPVQHRKNPKDTTFSYVVTSLFGSLRISELKVEKNRGEDFTGIIVCLKRFLSKQVAQNLSRQNPAPPRHTIRGHNDLPVDPNLRRRRIAQYFAENNGARTALWACSIMCALSCIGADKIALQQCVES
jgi:hypothetical protein